MRPRKTEPASALLIATIAVSVLAASAGLLMLETRAARASAGEALRIERARYQAEALLAHAIVLLDDGRALPASGTILDNEEGRVLRQDTSGLIDINAAPPVRLVQVLRGFGVNAEEADALGDRIADWRDPDDLVSLNGAERAEYEAAGRPAPANRQFLTEAELSAVMGMTTDLLECLSPYLTTYSGNGDLDPNAAPPDLLARLGQASPAPIEAPGAPFGRVIILSAEAPYSDHAILRLRIWMRLTGDQARPLMIHRAQEELAPKAPPPSDCPEPAADPAEAAP